jgi:topoisomerase-4 subunit B
MDPNTRRLVCLDMTAGDATHTVMDMLLGKKRAADRKQWLEQEGDKAEALA